MVSSHPNLTFKRGLGDGRGRTFFTASFIALMAGIATPVAAQDRQCQIADVSNGYATVIRDREKLRRSVGLVILQGDTLRKSASAQISITCTDKGEITIGRATEVDLGALIATPTGERRIFQILRGIAGFVMPAQAAPVEVRTLNAVASVRSTEWTVEVEGEITNVFVRAGVVSVMGDSGQAADLGTGEGVSVLADGTLGPVKFWGQGRIDKMNARLGGSWR